MKQKTWISVCCAALVLPLWQPPSFAEDAKRRSCGDLAGRLYHRHRYLYRQGPIASYNIGGTTVVSVSDLAGYGFQVEWDPETRWVTVTSAQRPERMPEPDITREVPGTVRAATMPLTSGCSSMAMSWSMSITLAGG